MTHLALGEAIDQQPDHREHRQGGYTLTFPASSLKFRTLSFPQYGFKLRCPTISPTLPDSAMGLSARSAYLRVGAGLIRPSPCSCLPAFSVGVINATSLRRFAQPPQPTGPLLRRGYVVPLILAPTTRSASLDDSRRLPSVTGYTAGLCPTTWSGLPPRPSPLWVSAPSPRAIIPTPGGEAVTPQSRHRLQRLSATESCVSSSTIPTPASVG